jgi:hypothetical protein
MSHLIALNGQNPVTPSLSVAHAPQVATRASKPTAIVCGLANAQGALSLALT